MRLIEKVKIMKFTNDITVVGIQVFSQFKASNIKEE